MRIKKRDGTTQQWDINKITKAILAAFHEVQPDSVPNITESLNRIYYLCVNKSLLTPVVEQDTVDIEFIQDAVETVLMRSYPEVAKAYIVYRAKRTEIREQRMTPDPMALGDYIHMAKYARHDDRLHRRETYEETVSRVCQMHLDKFPQHAEEIAKAFDFVHKKKILPSMRSMQFGGVAAEVNNARIYNCSFSHCDRIRVFQETIYLLLCGCGVGCSVQWRHVDRLPPVKFIDSTKVRHFAIPDTIEGWADAIGELFNCYYRTGDYFEPCYAGIRDEGELLRTSGGKAPGHLPLKTAIEAIRAVLDKAQGRKLRPVECFDIFSFEALAVLAGGIRRSSLIMLFSPEDTEMMYSKVPGNFQPSSKDHPGINSQREMANISAMFLRSRVTKEEFTRIIELSQLYYGEPGFYFTDDLDYGTNPCGEIGLNPILQLDLRYSTEDMMKIQKWSLDPGEGCRMLNEYTLAVSGFAFCNLCEINGAVCETPQDFYDACEQAAIIGTLQATYTQFPYLGDRSRLICERDALLGVGICGMMDNPGIFFDPLVLRAGVNLINNVNLQWSKKLGIRPSQRSTCVKPGGTAPLELGGVSSGITPQHARRFFRRVTANKNEPPAQYFRKYNPHMVEVKSNGDWSLIFPCEVPETAITVKEQLAADFIDKVFTVYENWIIPGTWAQGCKVRVIEDGGVGIPNYSPRLTHNVSCSVTIRDGEMSEIVETIWENRHRIAAMSFVPLMLDKLFAYAPREAVSTPADEAKWNYLISNYVPVPWKKMVEDVGHVNLTMTPACSGDKCEI